MKGGIWKSEFCPCKMCCSLTFSNLNGIWLSDSMCMHILEFLGLMIVVESINSEWFAAIEAFGVREPGGRTSTSCIVLIFLRVASYWRVLFLPCFLVLSYLSKYVIFWKKHHYNNPPTQILQAEEIMQIKLLWVLSAQIKQRSGCEGGLDMSQKR